MENNYQNQQREPKEVIIVNNLENKQKTNGIGTAGFVLALIGLFLGWVPFIGWLIWILGLILSFVGVFKTPKGLAIAGLVISLIGIILLIILGATVGAVAGMRNI